MPSKPDPIATLKRAVEIAEQIERLETELASILKGSGGAPLSSAPAPDETKVKAKKGRRRKLSPEARERIAAAARARWAKIKQG